MSNSDLQNHGDDREDESFWKKIKKVAVSAGKAVIIQALTLYYCSRDSDTPAWAKGTILSALAYFVLPLDAIPDLIPGAGYCRDTTKRVD